MKINIRILIIALFLLAPAVYSESVTLGDFKVDWTTLKEGIVEHEYLVEVQNLDDLEAHDFNLSVIISDTDFSLNKLRNMKMYEWKAVTGEYPIYETNTINESYTDGNGTFIEKYSYEQVVVGYEEKNKCQWKETKMNLVVHPEDVSSDYDSILIPKYESKEKYDDFGNVETVNGTKTFRIYFETPVVKNGDVYGNNGLIGIEDQNTNYFYHPFWNTTWYNCTNVTLTNPTSETLTDFPVFINITDARIVGNMTGMRIVNESCSNDGYELDFDIDNYDSTFAESWVELDSLPSGTRVISIYYYNSTPVAGGEDEAGTWNSNYKTVWHFNESGSGTHYDSTSNNQDLETTNFDGDEDVYARLGGGIDFDGVNDEMNVIDGGSALNLTDSITIEFWMYPHQWNDGDSHHITGNLGSLKGYSVRQDNDDDHLYFTIGNGASNTENDDDSGTTWNNDNWYYVTVVFDNTGNTVEYFQNGVSRETDTSITVSPASQTTPYYVGRTAINKYFNGTLDEIRVSDVARSDAWVNASYQFVVNQGTFVSFGSEEGQPVTTTTTTTTPATTTTTTPVICETTDLYGDDEYGSGTWTNGVDKVFDGNTVTYAQAYQSDVAYANYTLISIGKNLTITYKLSSTATGGSDPTLKFWNYDTGAWVQNCTDCTTGIVANRVWNEAIGNRGVARLYVTEAGDYTPKPQYKELYIDQVCYNSFESSDDILLVYLYDETNPATRLDAFDLNIYNSTLSQNYYDINIFIGNKTEVPTGIDTFTISQANYGTRTFNEVIPYSGLTNKTYYLVPTSQGGSVNFVVVNELDSPISGATVRAIRTIGSGTVEVESKTTDSSGNVNMYLDQSYTYTIEASKSGYTSINYTINPTNPPYRLYLNESGSAEQEKWIFYTVSYSFSPTSLVHGMNTLQFSIYDWNNTLEYFEFNVSYNGTVLDSKYNDTLTGNAVLNTTINTTGYTGYFTATGRFKALNHSEYTATKYYWLFPYTNGSWTQSNYTFNQTFSDFQDFLDTEDDTVKMGMSLVGILLSIGIGGLVTAIDPYGNGNAGAIAMMVTLGIFWVLFPFTNLALFFVVSLTVVSIMLIRSNL